MSGNTYPDPISPEMLPNWAHISDYEIARDIADTETEIAMYTRLEWVDERRAFVAFLRRLQDARSLSALQLVAALHQERAS